MNAHRPSPQLDAFVVADAWARATDPETAHRAATRERGRRAAELEAIVIRALELLGEATSQEVADFTGERLVSVSPRFRPLARKGVVEERGKRRNPSGSPAIVWRIRADFSTISRPGAGADEAVSHG